MINFHVVTTLYIVFINVFEQMFLALNSLIFSREQLLFHIEKVNVTNKSNKKINIFSFSYWSYFQNVQRKFII